LAEVVDVRPAIFDFVQKNTGELEEDTENKKNDKLVAGWYIHTTK
jgi:hypothetical protein